MTIPECTTDDVTNQSNLWMIGAALALVACFAGALGAILIKHAIMLDEALPENERARRFFGMVLSWRWIGGVSLMLFVNIPFDMAALAFASQSLVVVLGAFTLILTQILGAVVLHETVTQTDFMAGAVIVVGMVVTTLYAPHEDWNYTLEDHEYLRNSPAFIVCEVLTSIAIIASLFAIHGPDSRLKTHKLLHPITYSFVAAAIGGQQVVFMKAVSTMIRDSISRRNTSNATSTGDALWETLYIVFAIVFAIIQLSYISKGCENFDGVLFLPLYEAMFMVFSVLFGSIYYKEFRCFSPIAWVMFSVGFAVTLGGVVILAKHRSSMAQQKKAADGTDNEDNVGGGSDRNVHEREGLLAGVSPSS